MKYLVYKDLKQIHDYLRDNYFQEAPITVIGEEVDYKSFPIEIILRIIETWKSEKYETRFLRAENVPYGLRNIDMYRLEILDAMDPWREVILSFDIFKRIVYHQRPGEEIVGKTGLDNFLNGKYEVSVEKES